MWMRVRDCGRAVRRPARMRDADVRRQTVTIHGQLFLELGNPADCLVRVQQILRQDRKPRRVVPAVLESLETLEQKRDCFARTYISDNSAHEILLPGPLLLM